MAEKTKIQTLNNISPLGLSRLPSERYTIGNDVANPDAILVRSTKMHDMEIPSSVKAIARAGAGTNNVPVAKMSERGVPVFNAPGANANAVKELVIAGMLIASRNLMPAWKFADSLTGEDRRNFQGSRGRQEKLWRYRIAEPHAWALSAWARSVLWWRTPAFVWA